jgi:hypothetical protein
VSLSFTVFVVMRLSVSRSFTVFVVIVSFLPPTVEAIGAPRRCSHHQVEKLWLRVGGLTLNCLCYNQSSTFGRVGWPIPVAGARSFHSYVEGVHGTIPLPTAVQSASSIHFHPGAEKMMTTSFSRLNVSNTTSTPNCHVIMSPRIKKSSCVRVALAPRRNTDVIEKC